MHYDKISVCTICGHIQYICDQGCRRWPNSDDERELNGTRRHCPLQARCTPLPACVGVACPCVRAHVSKGRATIGHSTCDKAVFPFLIRGRTEKGIVWCYYSAGGSIFFDYKYTTSTGTVIASDCVGRFSGALKSRRWRSAAPQIAAQREPWAWLSRSSALSPDRGVGGGVGADASVLIYVAPGMNETCHHTLESCGRVSMG